MTRGDYLDEAKVRWYLFCLNNLAVSVLLTTFANNNLPKTNLELYGRTKTEDTT